MKSAGDTPPLSEDLIFWAPLTYNDLTDHVSGQIMINTGNGTITWDDQQSMYKFQFSNGTATALGYWDVDFSTKIATNVNQEYTIVAKCMSNNRQGGFPYLLGLGNFNVSGSYKPHVNTNSGNCVNALKTCAMIRYSNNSIYFIDENRTEYNKSSHMSNPANWNYSNLCLKRVCAYFRRWSDEDPSNQMFAYIKDAMVFNRALTISEIAQL